jgi:hypothetical protein
VSSRRHDDEALARGHARARRVARGRTLLHLGVGARGARDLVEPQGLRVALDVLLLLQELERLDAVVVTVVQGLVDLLLGESRAAQLI